MNLKGACVMVNRRFVPAIVSLCCMASQLAAQEARGTLLGRVTDTTEAVVGVLLQRHNMLQSWRPENPDPFA